MGKRFELEELTPESFCKTTGEVYQRVGKLTITENLICIEGLHSVTEDKRAAGQSENEIEGARDMEKKQTALRGAINEFSPQSRARLIKALSIWDPIGPLYIVTLTYPREFATGQTASKHFDKFKRKLARDNPDWCACWKLEYQMRGAPHYHLVLEAGPNKRSAADLKDMRAYINKTWQAARGQGRGAGPARTQVDRAKSQKRAKFYLTKEVGKSVQGGKFWKETIDSKIDHFGRIWGWLNRKNMRLTGEEYYIPVQVAILVQQKLRKRIVDDMRKRGAVKLIDGVLRYSYNDEPLDEDMLPNWQLFPDAREIMAAIVQEVEAETGLQFYDVCKERPVENST